MWRKLLFIVSVVVLFSAKQAAAFSISPVKHFLTVDPGSTQTIQVQVTNDGESAQKYRARVVGVKQGADGTPSFAENTEEAEKWVVVKQSTVTAEAKITTNLDFVIAVPAGAEPRAHYVGLLVEEKSSADDGLGIAPSLASILMLQVAGTAKEDLIVNNWSSQSNVIFGSDLHLTLDIKNTGNIGVPVKIRAQLIPRFAVLRKDIDLLEIPSGNSILAGSARHFDINFKLKNGNIFDGWSWPGVYDATAQISYGRLGLQVSATQTIIYLPFTESMILSIALFVLVIILWKIKKKTR